jgi:diguanylate cyclase (GGDEF)-like protein
MPHDGIPAGKRINDTQGHAKGDLALKTVATILLTRLRKSDVTGRIGGDEFVVVMPETAEQEARTTFGAVRQQLLQAMSELALPVTFSVGIVTGNGTNSTQQLVLKADALMHEVKQTGRNNIQQQNLSEPLHSPPFCAVIAMK